MQAARVGAVVVAALSLATLVGCAPTVAESDVPQSIQSQPPSAGPATSTASSQVADGSLPKLGLPGTRGSPAGEYGWEGGLGEKSGMHRVVSDGNDTREATAMLFAVGPDCLKASQDQQTPARLGALQGVSVEPYVPPLSFGVTSSGMVTRAYAVAVGNGTLCMYLTWNAATTDDELAAGESILETLRAEAVGQDRIRIVFTLDDGWDTG